MTVVAAVVYRDGVKLRDIDLSAPDGLAVEPKDFVWIGLVNPDEAELHKLQDQFHLHPLAVEDAGKADQLPKVDVYGDQLFVVARTAQLVEGAICYGETDIFVGPRHVITVRHGSARTHAELRSQLEHAPGLLKHGVDYVLHAVLDFIVDGYFPIVEAIEEELLGMERMALDAFLTREQVTRLFNLRRDVARFRRMLGPMEEVASRLEHHDLPCIDPEVRPYFRDVQDHVKRVASMSDGVKEVLSSVLEVATLLEQQRQGDTTRRLAAGAAILAVPTAIAGVYGMNFDVMPELRWSFGYPLILGVMVGLCGYIYWRFKKANWL